jgi:hypothetical protein
MAVRRSGVFDPKFEGDIRSGIVATANALGMHPVDLATIISYETGGTFNPSQAGPTTKYGQHRGLIQFGEPQAKQYGVDWNDPLGSQLGPEGAVVRYFRDRGYKPGMGLLDAYSIVNAGGPGLYNRSDTAAGGAPGTVREKVEQQMGGHRQKAAALLGEGATVPYDPRGDTPSSGRPIGSELPGAAPSALTVTHPPNPAVGTGGVLLGTAKPKEKAKEPWWKRVGKAMAEAGGATNFGAGGAAPAPLAAPPGAAVSQLTPVAPINPQQQEANRQALALALARLNQNRLWG